VPMAEARDPRRNVPFALYLALATTAALFCAIQYVVVRILPAAAQTDRPLAEAARLLWGSAGAGLISIGALISVYGYLSAQMLHVPRLTFALAERGDFPRIFARIHRRFRTPDISILIFAVIVLGLAQAGNFKWNVLLSSVGRLFVYGSTCASLPVLRRKRPDAQAHRLVAGNGFAALGILFVAALASRMNRDEALRSMTIWAAHANFSEDTIGSIAPGKYADFVVMDQDWMKVAPESIMQTRIHATYSSGRKVYDGTRDAANGIPTRPRRYARGISTCSCAAGSG